MALTIHQKSVYLIIFNATMISRSVGKSLKNNKKLKGIKDLKDFKVRVFEELNKLTDLMDKEKLIEENILKSIMILSDEFEISFGQAQKAINVILKYHFYLTKNKNNNIKRILNCPIDSVILETLNKKGLSLTKINEKKYLELQQEIETHHSLRIEFDDQWDKQHLKKQGI